MHPPIDPFNDIDFDKHTLAGEACEVEKGPPSSLYDQQLEAEAIREGIRPVFLAKVRVLNKAIADLGMGRYQWELFVSAGFGWFGDNLWLQAIAIVMPSLTYQDGWPKYPDIRLATLALYAGLIVGAAFWGISSDIIGRRLAWNCTLVLSGIFGIAAGASPNFATFGFFIAMIGFSAGGNLPVDGALFLEFLPGNKQHLLTFLSAWWAVGQSVASLIAWVFLARWSCDPNLVGTPGYVCNDSNNSGWRYTYYTLGAMILLLSALRYFVLPLDESPKFLCSIGRDKDAVAVIHRIAKKNGRVSLLTVADLHDAAIPYFHLDATGQNQMITKFSPLQLLKNSLSDIDGSHIRALFANRRLAYSTSLILFIYGALGLAYPMFNAFLGTYLSSRQAELGNLSVDSVYSAYAYQSACGVVGSLLAALLVQWKRGGRKFAMALFTVLNGIVLFALTAARTSIQVNALTCLSSLFGNAFYGVLYGYAPEVFPTPSRGTGDALAASSSRICGIFAPVIAIYSAASKTPNGPVLTAASIFIVTGVAMLGLPVETQGKTAL